MNWYALFVKTGEEETLKRFIEVLIPTDQFRILIPKRKIRERRQGKVYEKIKTLLPGYVLIYAHIDVEFYYKLRRIPHLLAILKDKYEPVQIRDEEISVILALTNQSDVIGFSEIYKEGDVIRVRKGPLVGLEGIIESYDHRKQRLKIAINFMGKTKRIDLGAELVSK
jgi:transcriptional antiterminator NusG